MNLEAMLREFGAIVTTLSVLIPAVLALWLQIRNGRAKSDAEFAKLREEANASKIRQELTWKGIVGRGYVEAQQVGHLLKTSREDGSFTWMVSPQARKLYQEILLDLRELALIHKEEPQLAWAIEERYQQWMLDNLCVTLKVHGNGCTAIALVLARENSSLVPSPQGVSNV